VVLDPARNDFAATGLRVTTVLRLHRLVTLTTRSIVRQLGELSPSWQQETDKKLARLFGLRTFPPASTALAPEDSRPPGR
jgi:mRNA interferase MazF